MSANDPGTGASVPGGASPAPAPESGSSGAPPAPGSVAAPPAAPPQQDGNIRQLREQYEATKSKLEPWEKLGLKPEDARESHSTYTRMRDEVNQLGRALGYEASDIKAAWQKDPIATHALLRQMANDPKHQEQQNQPLTRAEAERIAQQKALEAIQPFQAEREQQLDARAESVFDNRFDHNLKTSFPSGLPDSNREALSGLAWALLLENPEGYDSLRARGDTSGVDAAYEKAKTTLLKINADYWEHEKKRIGGNPPAGPNNGNANNGKKSRSLAEIAADLNNEDIPFERALGR